jgi:hypothetical protein
MLALLAEQGQHVKHVQASVKGIRTAQAHEIGQAVRYIAGIAVVADVASPTCSCTEAPTCPATTSASSRPCLARFNRCARASAPRKRAVAHTVHVMPRASETGTFPSMVLPAYVAGNVKYASQGDRPDGSEDLKDAHAQEAHVRKRGTRERSSHKCKVVAMSAYLHLVMQAGKFELSFPFTLLHSIQPCQLRFQERTLSAGISQMSLSLFIRLLQPLPCCALSLFRRHGQVFSAPCILHLTKFAPNTSEFIQIPIHSTSPTCETCAGVSGSADV